MRNDDAMTRALIHDMRAVEREQRRAQGYEAEHAAMWQELDSPVDAASQAEIDRISAGDAPMDDETRAEIERLANLD